MFHGIITGAAPDVHACITLAISDSPTGNFKPASKYDSNLYKTSTLVRYTWDNTAEGFTDTYNNASKSWNNGFGCIDPEFVYDIATGNLMTYQIGSNTCYAITYGSWKQGIAVIYVDAETLKPVCTVSGTSLYDNKSYSIGDEMDAPADSISGNQGTFLVGRNPSKNTDSAYEGAQLIYNSQTKYYYMFVSMGELTYEYRVGVGRAYSADGSSIPTTYTDASSHNMSIVENSNYHSVGSKITGAAQLTGEYGWRSPGGQSVFRTKSGKIIFACHSRTTFKGGDFVLRLHQMFFNADGWPVINQNDYYDDYKDYTSDGSESLSKLTLADIAGTYNTILTVRGTEKSTLNLAGSKYTGNTADGTATESKSIKISSSGEISGSYTGTLVLASDGYSATITLSNYGTFKGYFLHAVDWAKKSGKRRTITFTTLCNSGNGVGEYFWGNKAGEITATTIADYTYTFAELADSFSVYPYPQYGNYTIKVGENTATSVTATNACWDTNNKGTSTALADGESITIVVKPTTENGTFVLEGNDGGVYAYTYTDDNGDEQAETGANFIDFNSFDGNSWGGINGSGKGVTVKKNSLSSSSFPLASDTEYTFTITRTGKVIRLVLKKLSY